MGVMATETDKRSLNAQMVMTKTGRRMRSFQEEPISRRRWRLRLFCLLDACQPQ